eukprot:6046895-Prymnesium_polylepis.1
MRYNLQALGNDAHLAELQERAEAALSSLAQRRRAISEQHGGAPSERAHARAAALRCDAQLRAAVRELALVAGPYAGEDPARAARARELSERFEHALA